MKRSRHFLQIRNDRRKEGGYAAARRRVAVGLVLLAAAFLVWWLAPNQQPRATGYWQTPLPGHTGISPSSAVIVRNLVRQYRTNYGSIAVTNHSYSIPIFVADSHQVSVEVTPSPGCNNFTGNTGTRIPIPPAAHPASGTDGALVINQPSTGSEWELWQAQRHADDSWSACWGGKLMGRAKLTGIFPPPYGLSASGISYLDTVVSEADVANGQIGHVLAMAVVDCNGMVLPADRTDCGADPGQPSEGTWVRLPPQLPTPPGLTPFARMVFWALQRYGAVVTDRGGAVTIGAEDSEDWAARGHHGVDPITASFAGKPPYLALGGIPWSSLEVIEPPTQPQ